MDAMKEAGNRAQQARRASMPWVERLARLGYAAKGIVYVLIGVLAVQAAAGTGSARVDQKTAFQTILQNPFGQFLLAIIAVGLAGYALWRFIQAFFDPEQEGQQKGGSLKRVGYGISGITYTTLAYTALQLDRGQGGGGSGNTSDLTARLLAQPMGRYLVIALGLAIVVVGVVTIYQAYRVKFERRFKSEKLNAEERRKAIMLGRVGYTAKGAVLALVGAFLLQAALQYDPAQAGGLGDALARLATQPYGAYLLAAVAIGLVAYGLYALFLSQYRRITVG